MLFRSELLGGLGQGVELAGYVPAFGWEAGPPSAEQTAALEKMGILPDAVESAGKASLLLDRLNKRRAEGLTTPKQIRVLERYGFQSVGTWRRYVYCPNLMQSNISR